MREGGKPLPLAFQYLIFMVLRPYDLNLVMIHRGRRVYTLEIFHSQCFYA